MPASLRSEAENRKPGKCRTIQTIIKSEQMETMV
jgi:hypothetical protein